MNSHNEIARLRNERDDLQEQVRCLTEVIAEMAGHTQKNLPGFTKLESRMIRCLEAADGRVVSKEGLMQAMYFDRAEDDPSINILDVYIYNVRTKSPDYRRRILNSRGEGYWMEAGASNAH